MAAPITTMFSFPFSLSRSPKTLIAALQRNTDRAIEEERRSDQIDADRAFRRSSGRAVGPAGEDTGSIHQSSPTRETRGQPRRIAAVPPRHRT